jgi:pyoverdine/dityrosine biosynthesis protein Dit1
VDAIRSRAAASTTLRTQVDGIHRFLAEDARGLDPALTASQARKRTRELAYEVVRRSAAWGRLVAAAFPGALRLSIHPQPDVSEKIGVHLLATEDAWLTPWHGVALFDGERWSLGHRADAEARGAVIVEEDGRAWSMALPGVAPPPISRRDA